jgi:hypothetical protein
MKSVPLPAVGLKEAMAFQFNLVDAITRRFPGADFLSNGDVGLVPGIGKPRATKLVEETLADFFGQEAAVLVRGAGTGAIRAALAAAVEPGSSLFVHAAPPYPTTLTTCKAMGLRLVESDFNEPSNAARAYAASDARAALVQLARQKPDDSYDFAEVVAALKAAAPDRPIVTDDNYAVMKVPRIGCQCGADMSCFSLFKLLGPEGVACVVGKAALVDTIVASNYSGGGQVQGHEALDALRALVYAPVALAIQAEVCAEIEQRLNAGEVKGVARAFVANAQSRVVIVELTNAKASDVLERAARLGAAPYPVGSESRYEIAPLFYRVSGTFLRSDPTIGTRMIRINPMRAGVETVLSILHRALAEA